MAGPFDINLDYNPLTGKSTKKNERQPVGSSQKSRVFDNQNGKCWKCRNPLKLGHTEYHHLKHVSKGGKSETGNLVALCANCHSEIHKKEKAEELDRKKKKPFKRETGIIGLGSFKMPKNQFGL